MSANTPYLEPAECWRFVGTGADLLLSGFPGGPLLIRLYRKLYRMARKTTRAWLGARHCDLCERFFCHVIDKRYKQPPYFISLFMFET